VQGIKKLGFTDVKTRLILYVSDVHFTLRIRKGRIHGGRKEGKCSHSIGLRKKSRTIDAVKGGSLSEKKGARMQKILVATERSVAAAKKRAREQEQALRKIPQSSPRTQGHVGKQDTHHRTQCLKGGRKNITCTSLW